LPLAWLLVVLVQLAACSTAIAVALVARSAALVAQSVALAPRLLLWVFDLLHSLNS